MMKPCFLCGGVNSHMCKDQTWREGPYVTCQTCGPSHEPIPCPACKLREEARLANVSVKRLQKEVESFKSVLNTIVTHIDNVLRESSDT